MGSHGSFASNFHEGSRSEYYALLAMSSLGTAVAVPHQEDHGVDLFCTLGDREGQRSWATSHYAVQVKSTDEPWVFDGERSIRSLIETPLPLFLCVVSKKSQRLRIYQTCSRYWAWADPQHRSRLELIPGVPGPGKCAQWTDQVQFDLGPPILEFAVQEIENAGFRERAWTIFKSWIDVDYANLYRVNSGMRLFKTPDRYETNVVPGQYGTNTQGTVRPDPGYIEIAKPKLVELVEYFVSLFHANGDVKGAVRAASLTMHLAGNRLDFMVEAGSANSWLSGLYSQHGKAEADAYRYAGIEAACRHLDDWVEANLMETQPSTRSEVDPDGEDGVD